MPGIVGGIDDSLKSQCVLRPTRLEAFDLLFHEFRVRSELECAGFQTNRFVFLADAIFAFGKGIKESGIIGGLIDGRLSKLDGFVKLFAAAGTEPGEIVAHPGAFPSGGVDALFCLIVDAREQRLGLLEAATFA